ncbi:MAG TPA: hypothetical protein VN659_04315 [Pyrinomonadaceae bacterium]|nr:hypothetical protein [Pyrinomonadaceae bacterium]
MQTFTISTPTDKLTISQNGAVAQNEPAPPASGIDKLLAANTTLAVWLIFFAVGGGIMALYYARIGYLPDIEWKAVLIYLFIGSIVGGVVGLLLTISLYFPGVIWSETIVYDCYLDFSYAAPGSDLTTKESNTELCVRSIAVYLALPFLGVLVLSHIALIFGGTIYWTSAIALLLLTHGGMRVLFRKKSRLVAKVDNNERKLTDNSQQLTGVAEIITNDAANATHNGNNNANDPSIHCDAKLLQRQKIKLSSWFTLSVFLNQISMYLVYRLAGSPTDPWNFFVLTVLCTSAVCVTAQVVTLRHRFHARQAIVAALMAAGLLLFTADNYSSLSFRLMGYYGLGGEANVSMLLTEKGTQIANELRVPMCDTRKLCDLEVLSKVGDHYFLKAGKQTFTFPKSEVVSFSRTEEKLYAYPAVTTH